MRLIELVFSVFLVSIFLGIWVSAYKPMRRLYEDFSEKSAVFERDKFVADSFKKLCSTGKSRVEDFSDWKSMCSSMWNFKNFEVCIAGRKDNKVLFVCKFDGHQVSAISHPE